MRKATKDDLYTTRTTPEALELENEIYTAPLIVTVLRAIVKLLLLPVYALYGVVKLYDQYTGKPAEYGWNEHGPWEGTLRYPAEPGEGFKELDRQVKQARNGAKLYRVDGKTVMVRYVPPEGESRGGYAPDYLKANLIDDVEDVS